MFNKNFQVLISNGIHVLELLHLPRNHLQLLLLLHFFLLRILGQLAEVLAAEVGVGVGSDVDVAPAGLSVTRFTQRLVRCCQRHALA